MVAKISFGSSLYGALAYNGEKINKEEGKLLTTNNKSRKTKCIQFEKRNVQK